MATLTKRHRSTTAVDRRGHVPLTEYRPAGRHTLRVGDTVTLDTIRVRGPKGYLRKLTGPIVGIYRQPNDTVVVEVRDPGTGGLRTAYAQHATRKRGQ